MKAQQINLVPISGQQAPTVGLQAGTLPATTTAMQLDINSLMNMMIMIMFMMMMFKMMGKATESIA